MRRSLPCLLLLLLPFAAAHASNMLADKPRTDCSDATEADGAPTRPPATMHAPATASKQAAAPSGGGGGSDSDLVPRLRMPKWHSFLPGMFR